MSSNRPSTSKIDPRIAKKEVMVTRHKSAQLKRQLRNKNRSMKHLTDLLKSPTKETQINSKTVPGKKKTSPKAKQSLLQSVEKIQNLPQKTFKLSKVLRKEILLVPDEEYYPNKLKRKIDVKKVLLKPKNALKLVAEIAGSVKRKCGIPSKAVDTPHKPPDKPSSPLTKLSMAEAMRIMEEHLTDEDLMEILTCPSPVWWEDPPDENYVEEAVFTRTPSNEQADTPGVPEQMGVDTENIESDVASINLIPNLSAKSDKFLKKRSKLENLLGNIKDKSNTKSHDADKSVLNDEVKYSNDEVNSNEINVNEVSNCDNEKRGASLSESDDEIIFHNSSINEELLKDLENMDIPVANRSSSSDVIVIDDDDDDFLDKPTYSEDAREKEIKIKDEATVSRDTRKDTNEDINSAETALNEVPKNLPALQKCELSKVITSPRSFDSMSSKSSVVSSQDIDSISDTNIRFLEDEVDDKNVKDSNDKITKSNEILNESTTETRDGKASDDGSVTVYKIIEEISNDTSNVTIKNEILNEKAQLEEDKCNNAVKLNDYYKKCKKVYLKRPKKEEKTDINKNVTQTDDVDDYTTLFCECCKPSYKKVSDNENVKYCLICSSIFDTEECNYCIRIAKNRTHVCVACKIKFCCETFHKTHKCSEESSCRIEVSTVVPQI